MLLEAGVNIEYCELGYHHRHTPLVAAVHSGHTKVISALLEHQPTLNVSTCAPASSLLTAFVRLCCMFPDGIVL